MTKVAPKKSNHGNSGSTNLRWKLRSTGKRRGIHLASSEDDHQLEQTNKEGGSKSYNVYHRKNQHRVMPDPKIYIDDSQEHTTPRSNRGCSMSNENESVNASRNKSVNRVVDSRGHVTAEDEGAANITTESGEAEDHTNEANMLFFNNPAEAVTNMQAPTFNLLSDTDNRSTAEPILPPHKTTTNLADEEDITQMGPPTDVEQPKKKTRRGRGRTKMKSKGRREPWEPKIQLEFDEEGKVCSENATTFANLCGYYVRKHAPLQIKSWENVPSYALA